MPVHLVAPSEREALRAFISSLRESGSSVTGVLSSTGKNGRKHVEVSSGKDSPVSPSLASPPNSPYLRR